MAKKSSAVIRPNLGLYLDRPKIALERGMLSAGLNFRVKYGKLSNLNLGWSRFGSFTLNGPVQAVIPFRISVNTEHLLFVTPTDIYKYNASDESVSYVTPTYNTGTAAASGTAITGSSTMWDGNVAPGDEISFGASDEDDPAATWYEIDSVNSDTSITLTASAGTIADGAYTIRKKFTGDFADLWDWDIFIDADDGGGGVETQLWLTNNIDYPVRWNGTDDAFEEMSSLGFTCKFLHVFSNMMIYANVTQSGTNKISDIINSDVGKPDDVSNGLANQFKINTGSDAINGIEILGDSLVIYSKYHVNIAQFVGSDLVFVFRTISNNIGSFANRGIANFGSYHEFISSDAQYAFNGASLTQINDHIWREVLRKQDPARIQQLYAFFDDQNGDLIYSIPLATDAGAGDDTQPPEFAYVEHYLEDVTGATKQSQYVRKAYSYRTFPFTAIGYYSRQAGLTWDQITDAWEDINYRWNDQFFAVQFPLILVGDANGKVYTLNTSQNANGSALETYATFGRTALVDGMIRGLLARIYPFVAPYNNDITITVSMYDHASATSAVSTTELTYDQNLNESDYFVTPYRRGRFVEITFGSNGLSLPWELDGYDTDVRSGGRR